MEDRVEDGQRGNVEMWMWANNGPGGVVLSPQNGTT